VEMLVLHAIQCDSGSRDVGTGTGTVPKQANCNTSKQHRSELALYLYRPIS
jgi:hypothetical protein